MKMDKLHLARLKKGENTYEVVVDPDLAMEFRENKEIQLRDVLKSDTVFFDAKKGLEASHEHLAALFGTEDMEAVAKEIILHGEIQLSAEFREKKRQEKRKQIIDIIHRNGIDPKTNLPHPVTRIENALEEAKVRIDENKTADGQVQDILKALKPIMPIKFVTKEIQVHVPKEYAGKLYGNIINFGKMVNESWNNDGSVTVTVEIPGGLETDFYDQMNSLSQGTIEAKVIKVN